MNYGKIIKDDVANGKGIRLSLFVSGCERHCKGCFNPETWNFEFGEKFTHKTLRYIIDELKKPQYDGITILGGEPMHPLNVHNVADIIREIKNDIPNRNIWLYTGYTYEELKNRDEDTEYILDTINVLVDGPFEIDLKDITLDFRGSSNQRILELN